MNLIHSYAPASSRRFTLIAMALALALVGAMTFAAVNSAPAQAKLSKKAKAAKKRAAKKKGLVSTMTRNLYLGADLSAALAAPSTDAFIDANGQVLRDVDTNNFPVRAKGLAAEIKGKSPDLIGLQEVALWRTGPVDLNAPISGVFTASGVHVDYLKELMGQLNKGKRRYRVVHVQNEFDFEAPADYNNVKGDGNLPGVNSNGEINGRLTMRDVVLAKVRAGIKIKNIKSANYKNIYKPKISGIEVPIQRGWISLDAKVRKSPTFRFVDTHFEAFGTPELREEQAKELLEAGGPLRSGKKPAILVGDLNSDDDTVPVPERLAYNALKQGGMVERGFSGQATWGVRNGIITAGNGKRSDFTQFLDHVMTNKPNRVKKVKASVTGLKPVHGYWDSDHAGTFAQLRIR